MATFQVRPFPSKDTEQDVRDEQKAHKQFRHEKSNLGENFVAPDGGWAWLVCIAAGLSNLSIYPCLQQFGLIFRERLTILGMSNSQITTLINTNSAISACTGLLNGPMFRRFSFRQVALFGSIIIFTGILFTAFCDSFFTYLISCSLILGFGIGISVSSSSLAINTYFQKKRRRAAGFSWTITGLGPIFFPYTVSLLIPLYGVQGTCLIFAAISLHSLVSAIIYQPVRYHTKPSTAAIENVNETEVEPIKQYLCRYCELQGKTDKSLFSSQYLYKDDDEDKPGYEIIEPGTPMLSRANDGLFGSKLSLSSSMPRLRFRTISSSKDLDMGGTRLQTPLPEERTIERDSDFFKPNNFSRERDELNYRGASKSKRFSFNRANSILYQQKCTCAEERNFLQIQEDCNKNTISDNKDDSAEKEMENSLDKMTFMQKVIAFFDLDLLKDFTFVNLVVGLTIINFGELNFSILTPFILNDFGFDVSQITMAMSILAGCDIIVRFLVPFITEKIPWDNRVFFLMGVVGIAIGRTVVACTRSFIVILCAFCWIGVWKGVRTIFWPLIIPSYVPLRRLPAASGLQLLITGLFSLICGPFVGLIRDRFNYSICLHFLNALTFIAAISWTAEALIRRHGRKRKEMNNANM